MNTLLAIKEDTLATPIPIRKTISTTSAIIDQITLCMAQMVLIAICGCMLLAALSVVVTLAIYKPLYLIMHRMVSAVAHTLLLVVCGTLMLLIVGAMVGSFFYLDEILYRWQKWQIHKVFQKTTRTTQAQE